jgi:hypothetical protein
MRRLARELGLGEVKILSYRILTPSLPKTRATKAALGLGPRMAPPGRFHVIVSKYAESGLKTPQVAAVVAKEEAGQVVSYRQFVSR